MNILSMNLQLFFSYKNFFRTFHNLSGKAEKIFSNKADIKNVFEERKKSV